jgi:hypothetical protein
MTKSIIEDAVGNEDMRTAYSIRLEFPRRVLFRVFVGVSCKKPMVLSPTRLET